MGPLGWSLHLLSLMMPSSKQGMVVMVKCTRRLYENDNLIKKGRKETA